MVPSEPDEGSLLGERYRIGELIASGAMGAVHRAVQTALDREVAIKFLHGWMALDVRARKRFEVEAQAMAKLRHPHCAQVLDFGLDGETPYLVMEFVEGETLRAVLDRGPVPPARALAVARQALSALAHAHQHGITHRDIKPDNLIVGEATGVGVHVRVLDFGIARLKEDGGALTGGMAIGTPKYMAPEQAGGEGADERADLYATAVVLYEMLAGAPPFAAAENVEVFRMHREDPPPPLASKNPELAPSPELGAILARALAKDPQARFPDAESFAEALSGCPEAAPSAPHPRASAPHLQAADSGAGSAPPQPPPSAHAPHPAAPPPPGSGAIQPGPPENSTASAPGAAASAPAPGAGPWPSGGEGEGSGALRAAPPSPIAWLQTHPGLGLGLAGVGATAAAAALVALLSSGGAGAEPESASDSSASEDVATESADIPDAIEAAREAVETDPEGAVRRLEALTREHGEVAEGWYLLGRAYFSRKWWSDGMDAFRRAFELDDSYREDEVLIETVTEGFISPRAHDRIADFLAAEIGADAEPYVAEIAEEEDHPRVRERAEAALERFD